MRVATLLACRLFAINGGRSLRDGERRNPANNRALENWGSDMTRTYGSQIFGPLYDVIGWIAAVGIFVYFAPRCPRHDYRTARTGSSLVVQ